MSVLPRSARWCGALVLALALVPPAWAQTPGLGSDLSELSSAAQAARSAASARRALDRMALEGPLDPATYLVGPGDVFTVSIGGSLPRQTDVVVSADGTLAVPEAGSFEVAGQPLGAVQARVGAALRNRYRNVPADVTLASPREFYVHVSGDVPLPGRQLVNAVSRVSDALELAAGGVSARALGGYGRLVTPPAPEDELEGLSAEERARIEQQRLNVSLANATIQQRALAERGAVWPDYRRLPALRNVQVRRRGGAAERVDLVRYFATGDTDANPLLHDGDAVYLPSFDPSREGVSVGGAVDRPGVYDVRPDDTVLAVLTAATGTDGLDRVQAVRLTRAASGSALEVPLADAGAVAVGARDQLYAIEADPEAGVAEVIGAVRYPGLYPITSGATTLTDLVEMAGGLRDDALPRGAFLERRSRTLPAAVTGDEATLSDLSLFGRQFITTELAKTPRQPVNLAEAASAPPVQLIDGDRLVVPRDLGGVRVFGQVTQAGYVPFRTGWTAADYVEAAGGVGPAATETYVVEAGSGRLVAGAGAPVRAGDAVFVDRRPTAEDPTLAQIVLQQENAALQAERDRRQFLFQTISTTVSTLGFLISTYFLVRNNN